MTSDPNIYYPIRTSPRHQCERCHTWHRRLERSHEDNKWVCWRCAADDLLAVSARLIAEHMPDETYYPVPPDNDDGDHAGWDTIPHV